MLALDSSRWSELTHAYGSAKNIPALLSAAEPLPQCSSSKDEPYFGLWSALCHQGDVYAASYAALPHLVEIIRTSPGRLVVTLVDLVGCIEMARLQGRGPAIPDDLSASYTAALARLPDLAVLLLSEPRGEDECRAILSALAAAQGHPRLAAAISELTPEIAEQLLERWIYE